MVCCTKGQPVLEPFLVEGIFALISVPLGLFGVLGLGADFLRLL